MKTCRKCRQNKDDSFFSKHPKTKDRLNSWCRDCKRLYGNPKRENIRKQLDDYKKEHGCYYCRENNGNNILDTQGEKMTGATLIQNERDRQRDIEKYTSVHDDGFKGVELARFAACYLFSYIYMNVPSGKIADLARNSISELLPFSESDFKPTGEIGEINDLVKAGALIAAEIDRLQRIKDGVSSI